MKKILIALLIVAALTTTIIFANTSSVSTREELIKELSNRIGMLDREITIIYKNKEGLDDPNFGMSTFKEAISTHEYLKNNYSRVTYNLKRGTSENTLTWKIEYRTTEYEESVINAFVKKEGEKIKSKTSDKSEMVYLVNEFVKSRISYSFDGVSYGTAYGAIMDGKVVCHGYTLLTERLLTYLGVENKIVVGYTIKSEKHSWNLVKLDNIWYHMDVTYNDTAKISNEYFLKSDSYMSRTRTWDYFNYPIASENYQKEVLYASTSKTITKVEEPFENLEKLVEEITKEETVIVSETPKPTQEVVTEVKKQEPSTWSLTYMEKAVLYNLVPSKISSKTNTSILTREELIEVVMQIFYNLDNRNVTITKSFSDTTNETIIKAYNLGITSGVSEGIFSPNQTITREEAAVMFYRLMDLMNKTHSVTPNYISDINLVSSWALKEVEFLNAVGIINGTSANTINPKGNLTKEQALTIAVRVYEYAK